MKKAIVPPTLLTVARSVPLMVIATKSSATVIKENETSFGSASKVISINNKTKEINIKSPDTILSSEPEWYADYE